MSVKFDSNWMIQNYQSCLMDLYPEFALIVQEEKQFYKDFNHDYTEHSFFRALTIFTKNLIKNKKSKDIKKLMEIAEILLEHGSVDVQNAVATCYIENLVNAASNDEGKIVKYETFVPYLGPKAKEYCRAWDEFTGCKTPGVYN